jgi:hypothetical protein
VNRDVDDLEGGEFAYASPILPGDRFPSVRATADALWSPWPECGITFALTRLEFIPWMHLYRFPSHQPIHDINSGQAQGLHQHTERGVMDAWIEKRCCHR